MIGEGYLGTMLLEDRLDRLEDCFEIYSAVRDEYGIIVDFLVEYVNEAACRYRNLSREAQVGKRLLDIAPEYKGSNLLLMYKRVVETSEACVFDAFMSREQQYLKVMDKVFSIYASKSGDGLTVIWKELTGTYSVSSQDEMAMAISAIYAEEGQKNRTEEALMESENRFRSAFDNAAIGMTLTSLDGRLFKVNASLCGILGYGPEELVKLRFHDVTHPEDLDVDLELRQRLVAGEIPYYHMEKRYFHKKGHIVWGELSVSVVRNSCGKPLYYISQIQDITQRKLVEEELQKARRVAENLAQTDFLTGILNRRAFNSRLSDELAKRIADHTPLCIALDDIDHFKRVNDIFGHNIGDMVLQQFAKCLSENCRQHDFIGRHGGEEFLICLPDTSCEQAGYIAERMRRAVEELVIQVPDSTEKISITASFGIAMVSDRRIADINALIAEADGAMYSAKQAGRNRVHSACGI